LNEALSIGVLADQLAADAIHTVDGSHQFGRRAQSVQVLNHRNLMRNRKVPAFEAQGSNASDGVFKTLGRDFERQIPPIQTGSGKGTFDHKLRGIAGHGLPHAANDLLQRIAIRHVRSPRLTASRSAASPTCGESRAYHWKQ